MFSHQPGEYCYLVFMVIPHIIPSYSIVFLHIPSYSIFDGSLLLLILLILTTKLNYHDISSNRIFIYHLNIIAYKYIYIYIYYISIISITSASTRLGHLAKVAEKMEEIWRKGRQMLAQAMVFSAGPVEQVEISWDLPNLVMSK